MSTIERLTSDMTAALKARDHFALGTLRQVIGAVRAEEKAGKVARELTDEQVQAVLVGEVKKRRESATIYAGAGAQDRADNESAEADLIETYLPAALSDADVDDLVARAIAEVGATSVKDMGQVMKAANAAAAASGGRVDGKALSAKVRAALTPGT
ncbi:GatB/YqeY domain-containing protein [Xylanimonas protaetiae]|uniref:GatB/YqeY domain-containing protein n=1 Tax=Xylanimonas protaetiae TaxID=2509457 RepID=A0A4P6F691_9MICO|nr:GatB/YqeY domain-containing protein [Xylanimonas protaetiae]QAY70936.1 GatB/YqeY domain-containing protein [Xylanimonas protaetiae]